MRKKILLAAPPPGSSGGISRWTGHILAHYERLAPEEKEVELLFLPMARSIAVGNTSRLKRLFKGIRDYSVVVKNYRQTLRLHAPEVVQIVSSASVSLLKDWILVKIASRKKIKTIVHFHFGRIPDLYASNNWEWKLLCRVIRLSDQTLVIDQTSYTTLEKAGFTNIGLLPNPLSDKILEQIRNHPPSPFPKERQLLFTGQMLPAKGIFELVEACKEIPDIRLKMVGTLPKGIKEQLLAKSCRASGEEWLEIAGEKEHPEVIEEMLSASLFVLPTYTEGFPNVILESMACGCPIIASAVGAIPEMLDIHSSEPSGICVPPKEVKPLKEAILKLLEDKDLAFRYGRNAQRRVDQEYRMSSIWRKMTNIWKSI